MPSTSPRRSLPAFSPHTLLLPNTHTMLSYIRSLDPAWKAFVLSAGIVSGVAQSLVSWFS